MKRVPDFCEGDGSVALTFDEGPSDFTTIVLDQLASSKIKVTFHVITKYLNTVAYVANMRRAFKDGHVIGLRFPTTVDPTQLTQNQLVSALRNEANQIFSVIGTYPKFIRLPSDKLTDDVVAVVQSEGYIVTKWTIDPMDYTAGLDAAQIVAKYSDMFKLVSKGTAGYISLHHDIYTLYRDKPDIIPTLVNAVQAAGYKFVTLDKCLLEAEAYRATNGEGNPTASSVKSDGSESALVSMWSMLASVFSFFLMN